MFKSFLKKSIRLFYSFFNKGTIIYCLKFLVFAAMVVLILISLWSIGLILLKCFVRDHDFTLNGLLLFINLFTPVVNLIAATLLVIGLFIAIERITLMAEANELKASETWKKNFDKILEPIEVENPYMAVYFEQISDKIYKYLYKRNFVIYNKLMLRFFVWKYIDGQIFLFETKSKKYINNNEKYADVNEVCSLDEIKKVISFIFRLSHQYEKLEFDFEEIYKKKVKPIAKKNIENKIAFDSTQKVAEQINNPPETKQSKLTVSYLFLRRIVGILGFSFPIVLAAGSFLFGACTGFQDSISDYHNTNMRDVFVGLLSAIALFLFVYSGYDKLDSFMAKAAGILGFMVAIFPDGFDDNECTIYVKQIIPEWVETVHFAAATLFFLVLAYFSLFLFTKSEKDNEDPDILGKGIAFLAMKSIMNFFQKQKEEEKAKENAQITAEKAKRNRVYKRCGYTILGCLVVLFFYFRSDYLQETFGFLCPVLIFETIALWAFAYSWFIKGKTLIKDK